MPDHRFERSGPDKLHPRHLAIMIILMTFLMGVLLSGAFTLIEYGTGPGFARAWLDRFIMTYLVVLPTVAVVAPVARTWAAAIDARFFGRDWGAAAPLAVALAAWCDNAAGHRGEGFDAWLARLDDDVRISMPVGEFRGENIGADRARTIYAAIASAGPDLVYEAPQRVTASDATVVIEFEDHGTIAGQPYRNRIAASFDIAGDRITAYREYFGDIDPAIVALMNGRGAQAQTSAL